MGKASKKKVSTKKSQLTIGTDQKGTTQELKWDDLVDYIGKINNLIQNIAAQLSAITSNYKEDIAKDRDIDLLIQGFALSLDDLRKEYLDVMKLHTTENNGSEISYKTGSISSNETEIFDFLAIAGKYGEILDKLRTLASQGYLNIFMKLKAYDVEKVKSFENYTKENNGTNTKPAK